MKMFYIKQYLILCLVNLIFFLLATFLQLERVLFNIDYLLCILLFSFNYKKLAFFLLLFFCLSDVLLLIRQIFPFFRLDDILYVIKFIFISSGYYQGFFLVGIFITIAIMVFYNQFRIEKNFLIYSSFFISVLYFSESIYAQFYTNYERKLFDSQVVNFINLQYDGFTQTLNLEQENLMDISYSKATKSLYQNINNKSTNNQGVLLIVAESLGMPKDKKVMEAMIYPLTKQKELFNFFEVNKEPYNVPTVYGELRELCHARPQNFNLKNLTHGFEDCLPHHFKRLGYETTAMHGALSIMYDRKHWYPRAGFDKNIFYEYQDWQKQCYSFSGACDIELANIVSETFNQPKKQFFYWLTLNSHAIYDERDIFIDLFDCQKFGIDVNSESCRNIKLQTQFFEVLSKIVEQKQFKDVEVIIVGDHTPIIFNQKEKEKYFDGDNVLIVNFSIKK